MRQLDDRLVSEPRRVEVICSRERVPRRSSRDHLRVIDEEHVPEPGTGRDALGQVPDIGPGEAVERLVAPWEAADQEDTPRPIISTPDEGNQGVPRIKWLDQR